MTIHPGTHGRFEIAYPVAGPVAGPIHAKIASRYKLARERIAAAGAKFHQEQEGSRRALEREQVAREIERRAREREAVQKELSAHRVSETIRAAKQTPHALAKSILLETALEHGGSVADILSDRRCAKNIKMRQEAMWRVIKATGWSLPRIGRLFNRDHTTILHGARKYEKENPEACALFLARLEAERKLVFDEQDRLAAIASARETLWLLDADSAADGTP